MNKKRYAQEELASIIEMVGQGATYKEIGEMFGRTPHSIEQKLNSIGCGAKALSANACNADEDAPLPEATLAKQKTLNDYTIRELIKNLYDRGCRIRNNKVYVVIEKSINISDIIKG